MTQINLENPQIEQFLTDYAQKHGVDLGGAVEHLAREHIQRTETVMPEATAPVNPETDPLILLMKQLEAQIPTDPDLARQADAEYEEFMLNLNRNRIDAGEEPLF